MALISPVLFSSHFGVPPVEFDKAGLLDPILNSDTKLFLDPLLVLKSRNKTMRVDGSKALEARFRQVIDLLAVSNTPGDAAWKGAYRALDLDECSETGLGFGGSGTSGSSRSQSVRTTILSTAKEIITLGEKDPNVIPLMGLFESGVGADTISDMTSNFVLPTLCKITESFCKARGVTVQAFDGKFGGAMLPLNPYHPHSGPVLLVPRDILRDLPFATDWADVSRVVLEVDEIRHAVNSLLGNFAKASVSERKDALKEAALADVETLREILKAVVGASDSYDEQADLSGFYTFRNFLNRDSAPFKGMVPAPADKTAETLRDVVLQIIEQFRNLVEDNNLWELLWHGAVPRNERAAQLLFFAVANVICYSNNIDISPETNSGGGPVDFKFSTGYHGRLLVEIKLSKGRVVHGYTRQLEIYKQAAATQEGIYLVVDVGGMGRKLRDIETARDLAEARGERVSHIELVNAKRQASASKRE